jgi:hypothetical protein
VDHDSRQERQQSRAAVPRHGRAFGGSLRGRLLLTGTLGFFLYTYMSMSMLTAYNSLFLVYVALFTLSLYAFILSMLSFDLADLPRHFFPHLPHGWIAGVLFAVGSFLLLAWMGRIVSPLLQSQTPALENTTTLVIQTMDQWLGAGARAKVASWAEPSAMAERTLEAWRLARSWSMERSLMGL